MEILLRRQVGAIFREVLFLNRENGAPAASGNVIKSLFRSENE
jgi:hypothetical protein